MDRSLIREELVNFIADVLSAAVDRMGDRLEGRLKAVLSGIAPMRPETLSSRSETKRFMNLKEFGEFVSLKPAAAWKMLQREKPPAGVVVRMGQRRIRVDVEAFKEWLASRNAK